MIIITGVSSHISPLIAGANRRLRDVELMVAIDFGVISPNININNVRIPVAIPAPTLPNMSIARVVAREEADRFTMLFPINIADSIFLGRVTTFKTLAAFLLPSSAMVFSLILFTVVSAVSADEKNAERTNNNKRIISLINRCVSNNVCSFYPKYYFVS